MKYVGVIIARVPERFRNKKSIFGFFLILVLVFLLFRGGANEDLIITAQAENKSIKSEIFSTGKIRSESEANLNFAVSGRVQWIGVDEGDLVAKGRVIATLNRENLEAALRKAQQDVIDTDADLRKLYDAQKDNDSLSYDEQIERTAIEAAKNKAFDNMRIAERNLRDATLISPVSGQVVSLDIHTGDEVFSTETVAKIADIENLYFLVAIDEADIGDIEVGQSAIIFLDAYPEEEIMSSIISIGYEGIVTATEATVFEIKLGFENNEKYILGMNGDIQIIVSEKENVLTIPTEALFEENEVIAVRNGQYEKVDVETGIESDTDVEIISGLNTGDVVITSGFDEIDKKNLLSKIIRI